MRTKDNYHLFDTETCGGFGKPLAYDISGAIVDNTADVKATYKCIIKEIYEGKPTLMKSAYYAEKLPLYAEFILNGQREVVPFDEARKRINALCEEYNVKANIAHNMKFDYCSTKATAMEINGNEDFLPNVPLWDTLAMARSVIQPMKSYKKFCEENGYMTKHKIPKPRLTAEIIYRFISGNNDFVESHTAFEDVEIEKEIFAYCIRKHKKMERVYTPKV